MHINIQYNTSRKDVSVKNLDTGGLYTTLFGDEPVLLIVGIDGCTVITNTGVVYSMNKNRYFPDPKRVTSLVVK